MIEEPKISEPKSEGAMRIRRVAAGDFAAIATITNHYIATTSIHFGTEPVAEADLCDSWLKACERYPFVVAEEGGKVLGYAKAGVWRERAAYAWTPEAGVYVRPGSHRRGLGRAMYERLFAIMARQGFRSVIAGVTVPNDASVAMHRSMGFVPQGVIKDAGWKFDRWWDVAFFQKQLATDAAGGVAVRPVSEVENELDAA